MGKNRFWNTYLYASLWLKAALLGLLWFAAPVAYAQSSNGSQIPQPDFSIEDLNFAKSELSTATGLTPEQITAGEELYDIAIGAMQRASAEIERAAQLKSLLESSPRRIQNLRDQLQKAQAERRSESQTAGEMTGENLLRLEQSLIAKSVELRDLQSETERYQDQLKEIAESQPRAALTETEQRLQEINNDLSTFSTSASDPMSTARRYSLEARQYMARAQIAALQQEITSMPARQLTMGLRRDIAVIQTQNVEAEVLALQDKTGLRRLEEARAIVDAAESEMSIIEKAHPFVIEFAGTNANISHDLLEIAQRSSTYPKRQADARRRRDDIKNDLTAAQQLTNLDQINRQSSATLRRLRNQRPPVFSVRAEINQTQKEQIEATQTRLWAQEQLRQFPFGEFDYADPYEEWVRSNPNTDPMTQSDIQLLQALYSSRRGLLQDVSEAAFSQSSEAEALEIIQNELLKNTTDLTTLLDQKLLWLPSVTAINLRWPEKVLRGTADVFNFDNFSRALSVFYQQIIRYSLIVLLFIILIGTTILFRGRLRAEIEDRSRLVGRVQKDSYWHTPSVLIACAFIAAPLPLFVLLIGFLFKNSGSPDLFVTSLGQTGIELAGFLWFFLMWGEWNRERSLFDAHYKLAAGIRRGVLRQLRWFIPFAGVTIAIVTLTQNSREPDVYEGISLLAFIVTAIALSVFGFKILWAKRTAFQKALSENDLIWRYRHIMTFLVVALPVLAALLAAAGYYDTARELLSRLFFSAGLLIATYAAYGLIKRTVVVAQRRLALRQAMERREKVLKAREEKEAAEERGDPPPPVNYEEIDLEAMSRQSSQLLNTMIAIGFAVLMWVFWQDLLPALSIFDGVKPFGDGIDVSLWNIIQALGIAVLTFIAAKNLPGFLEVFVLNRSNFDRGTRYAIVSVLGYIIMGVGIVWAFDMLGMQWSQLQWIAAALSVGIGFGLQEIIANFISGLIILFERPVRVGDYVTIGDQSGTVNRIKIRATTLGDLDNREILIPNKSLITERVINWTLSNSVTRMTIRVGVAYGTDTDKARDTILKVVTANENVLESPRPQVFFLGFGDSSLDFEIRVFLKSFEDRYPVSHVLHTEINKALEKAGVTIPFPQRDLHIVSGPPEAKTS